MNFAKKLNVSQECFDEICQVLKINIESSNDIEKDWDLIVDFQKFIKSRNLTPKSGISSYTSFVNQSEQTFHPNMENEVLDVNLTGDTNRLAAKTIIGFQIEVLRRLSEYMTYGVPQYLIEDSDRIELEEAKSEALEAFRRASSQRLQGRQEVLHAGATNFLTGK